MASQIESQHGLMHLAEKVSKDRHPLGESRFMTILGEHAGAQEVVSVRDAISQAKAAGIPWLTILAKLAPFLMALFTGGGIDIPALIAAILSLITPAPAPVPQPHMAKP